MERREFIKHSAAVATVTAVGGFKSVSGSELARCPNTIVLVDERYSDSRRFAASFAAQGATLISLERDIGQLWYGELREHCAVSHATIAGLTQHTDLFVSQLFARDIGKSLVHVGTHDCRGRRTLSHSLPADIDLADVDAAGGDWAEQLARTMIAKRAFSESTIKRDTTVERASDHPGSLFSWMIV